MSPRTDLDTLRQEWILLRALARLGQEEAGRLIGTNQQTISNWERGSNPRDDVLAAIRRQVAAWKIQHAGDGYTSLVRDRTTVQETPQEYTPRRITWDLSTVDIMRAARAARRVNRTDLCDKLFELADQVDSMRDQLDEIRAELDAVEREYRTCNDEVHREYVKIKKDRRPKTLKAKSKPPPKM